MAEPAPPPSPFTRAQAANFLAFELLISLVNVLSIPHQRARFTPRRVERVRILKRDIARWRMLQEQFASEDEAAIRGYLLAVKAIHFEVSFLLRQEPELKRNETFFEDFERLGNLISDASSAGDMAEMRTLAYKLSITLPYFEDEAERDRRNKVAKEWYQKEERRK